MSSPPPFWTVARFHYKQARLGEWPVSSVQKLKMYLAHNNYKKLNPNNWQMWKLILLRRCKQIRFLNFSVIHYYFLWLTHKSLLYSFVQLVTAPVTVCTLSVLLCSIVIKIKFRYLTFSSGNIRIMWFFIHFDNDKKMPSRRHSFLKTMFSCFFILTLGLPALQHPHQIISHWFVGWCPLDRVPLKLG